MKNRDLIFDLENGRQLDVVLVTDKNYSMNLLGISRRYSNLNIKVLEKEENYMHLLEEMKNIDIIIDYHEKKEDIINLGQLERLAFNSSSSDHRVTIGYSYANNDNKGIDNVIISSYKDESKMVQEFEIDNEYTPYDLLQITLNEHDDLEVVKALKYMPMF